MGGTKFDQGKPRLGLLDRTFLWGVAKVMTFGCEKYSANNWRKGIEWSRLYDALQRHVTAFWDGEDNDEETGLLHLFHAGCCLMFLSWHYFYRKDLDDRYKGEAND